MAKKKKVASCLLVILQIILLCCTFFSGCGGGEIYLVNFDEHSVYYSVDGEKTAKEGQDYTFTIVVKNGYSPAENFSVLVNGEPVRMNGTSYTVKNVSGNIDIVAKNFTVNDYVVNFKAGDVLLQSSSLQYGKMPQIEKASLQKIPKDYPSDYAAFFTGWATSLNGAVEPIQAVKGDTNYYAKIWKMPRYSAAEDFFTVHHTGDTQEQTLLKDATLCNNDDVHHVYDGKVWLLIATYENEVCLEYTIEWPTLDFEELLSDDKALMFACSANYNGYILNIEDKQIGITKDVYEVRIQNGALYLNDDKLLDIDSEVYNGTRPMLWSVNRSIEHLYAQFGFSDVGIISVADL